MKIKIYTILLLKLLLILVPITVQASNHETIIRECTLRGIAYFNKGPWTGNNERSLHYVNGKIEGNFQNTLLTNLSDAGNINNFLTLREQNFQNQLPQNCKDLISEKPFEIYLYMQDSLNKDISIYTSNTYYYKLSFNRKDSNTFVWDKDPAMTLHIEKKDNKYFAVDMCYKKNNIDTCSKKKMNIEIEGLSDGTISPTPSTTDPCNFEPCLYNDENKKKCQYNFSDPFFQNTGVCDKIKIDKEGIGQLTYFLKNCYETTKFACDDYNFLQNRFRDSLNPRKENKKPISRIISDCTIEGGILGAIFGKCDYPTLNHIFNPEKENNLLSVLINFALSIAAVLVTIYIVISGYKIMIAGASGNPKEIGAAKSGLTAAIIGLIIILLAQFIVLEFIRLLI